MSTRLYIFFLIFLSISNVFSQSFENISLINNNITSYPFNESNAYLSIDGNSLFFNSSDNINNTGGLNDMNDIWYRNRNNGLWEPPINLTQVNTNQNDIILGLNNDILIVLRNRLINYYDINNQFKLLGREEIVGFSTNYNLLTGSINQKSDIIFLSLEGYGTYGVEDIYTSKKIDGKWGRLKNIGSDVNSLYQDISPFLISKDTLVFISNRDKLGYELFYTVKKNNNSSDMMIAQDKKAIAILKNCPTSPRKMRLVVDQIRGLEVNKALTLLKHSSKDASVRLEKLLLSAIANWQTKHSDDSSDLVIKEIFVDSGRMLKRIQPAPQGRAHRIRKRSNHVTLILGLKQN